MADLVQVRRAAVQAVLAHRGGATAATKAAQVIGGLAGVVQGGIASGSIPVPTSPEELAVLMDRWLGAAMEAAIKVRQEEIQEALRFEGEARTLSSQIEAGGAQVLELPTVPAHGPEETPKGRVRRRKKDAAPAE